MRADGITSNHGTIFSIVVGFPDGLVERLSIIGAVAAVDPEIAG
jgi:hypothetical protein